MKKTYVKPFASFESFELSSSIAGTCVAKTNHARNECGYTLEATGEIIFLDKIAGCLKVVGENEYGVCYHNSLGNLFTS